MEIRNHLEKLSLTQAWALRETDLFAHQRKLNRIDESRGVDGNFVDHLGRPADLYAQRVCLVSAPLCCFTHSADSPLPTSKKLRLYIFAPHIIRAGL